MTHEELLKSIEILIADFCEGEYCATCAPYKAVRAVVELHKPFMYEGRFGKFERCSGCASEEEWLGEIYPCQTIQAIEAELQRH